MAAERRRSPANRCCRTSRQVWPHSLSSHSAASAIRRSPGRQDVELLAQPAAGAAVVGDRHDRGDPVGHEPQRGERGGQAVPAAERDDARRSGSLPPQVAVHEDGGDVAAAEPAGDSASAIATDRCLPPVQPTASVT